MEITTKIVEGVVHIMGRPFDDASGLLTSLFGVQSDEALDAFKKEVWGKIGEDPDRINLRKFFDKHELGKVVKDVPVPGGLVLYKDTLYKVMMANVNEGKFTLVHCCEPHMMADVTLGDIESVIEFPEGFGHKVSKGSTKGGPVLERKEEKDLEEGNGDVEQAVDERSGLEQAESIVEEGQTEKVDKSGKELAAEAIKEQERKKALMGFTVRKTVKRMFSSQEQMQKGAQLAEAIKELHDKEAEKKSAVSEFNDEIKKIDLRIEDLSEEIRDGYVVKDMEVIQKLEGDVFNYYDPKTKEVLMTEPADGQMVLGANEEE